MKILLIATVWQSDRGNPWLLDDLAAEFARSGHEVDVIVADPRTGRRVGVIANTPPGVRAWSVGPRRRRAGSLGTVSAHLVTAWRLRTNARRILRSQRYDLGLYTSVATFNWSLPRWVRRRAVVKRLVLVLWDFFPVHQLQIGRLRSRTAAAIFKRLERRAIEPADAVALMSDANVAFFTTYFPGLSMPIGIVRPWATARAPGPPRQAGTLRVVFGGQLAAGRDIDTLLDAAALMANRGDPVRLLIVGGGPALAEVRARAEHIECVEVHGLLPRDQYRALLATCDVGIAATVAGTTVPTFPSKIVEYCSAGVAVVVAAEAASDAGRLIEVAGAGISIPSGSAVTLADTLAELARLRESGVVAQMGLAALRLFETELSVARAAERLIEL